MENAIVRVPDARRTPRSCGSSTARRRSRPTASSSSGRPTCAGFWVAAGFCAHGLAGAGGMGKLVAEWIVEGVPSLDVWEMDSRRFGRALPQPRVHARALGRGLLDLLRRQVPGPRARRPGGRCASRPPTRGSQELGAAFGEKSGWERANWFEPNAAARRRVAAAARLGRPALVARDRRRASRRRARRPRSSTRRRSRRSRSRAPGAADFLERLCANRVARDVGAITYTSMLNARGGIECDFTVTRLAEERFRIVTGTAFGQHDLAWIRLARPGGRLRAGRGRHLALRLPRDLGADGARDPPAAHDGRPVERRVPLHARAGDRRRPRAVPRARASPTSASSAGSSTARPSSASRSGTRSGTAGREHGLVAGGYRAIDSLPAREGLPRLGRRHHARRHALRGRARLRGQARQGRLHRPRGAARRAGARAAARLRRPRRPALGRARLGAGPRSTARIVGRVTSGGYGYTVERSIAYAYVPAGRRRAGPAGRGRDLRRVGRGRGRGASRCTTRTERMRS